MNFNKGDAVYFDLKFGNNYSTQGIITSGNVNSYGGHDVRRVTVSDGNGGKSIYTRRVCDIRRVST
jgi:hypothetical protein